MRSRERIADICPTSTASSRSLNTFITAVSVLDAQLSERPSTPVHDQLLLPTLHSHISPASQIHQLTTSGRTALPAEFLPDGLSLWQARQFGTHYQSSYRKQLEDVSVRNILCIQRITGFTMMRYINSHYITYLTCSVFIGPHCTKPYGHISNIITTI